MWELSRRVATRRGKRKNRGNNFIFLPPDLLGLKLLYGSSHLPGRSYINPDWQQRWTVHIRRLSTMPLVQQWTVNVHGWQGGFVDTEKWERKEYKENTHFRWHFLDAEVCVWERESTYLHRHFLDPWQMRYWYLLIQRSERTRVLDCIYHKRSVEVRVGYWKMIYCLCSTSLALYTNTHSSVHNEYVVMFVNRV